MAKRPPRIPVAVWVLLGVVVVLGYYVGHRRGYASSAATAAQAQEDNLALQPFTQPTLPDYGASYSGGAGSLWSPGSAATGTNTGGGSGNDSGGSYDSKPPGYTDAGIPGGSPGPESGPQPKPFVVPPGRP